MIERDSRFVPHAAALAVFLAVAGCGSRDERASPDVLLVCLDAVRADHLGCYGYRRRPTSPHLDALAARSIRFQDASAAASWTKPSVPSFLTGRWPLEHGVYEGSARSAERLDTDVLPDDALTLAEVFASAGYATAAFVHNAQLKAEHGFAQGFGRYDEGNFDARELTGRARAFIEDQSRERPCFVYLHLLDAHFPCPVPEEYARMFAADGDVSLFRSDSWRSVRDDVNDGRRTLSEAERDSLEALYDGAIRYIDDELGRLFDVLARRDHDRELVVAVIADHGEEFLEHGRMGHGHDLYESLLRVPWLLHVPGLPPAEIESPVSLVDLFATLLAAARVQAPPSSGTSRLVDAPAETALLAEHKEPGEYLQSLRDGRWKLIRRFVPVRGSAPGVPRLPKIGSSVEVDFEPASSAPRLASEISLEDAETLERIELKGVVESFDATSVILAGVRAEVAPDAELYGELPAGASAPRWKDGVVAAGRMVKVVARADSGERIFVERIKLYGEKERRAYVLRGPVSAIEGTPSRGRLRVGAIWIDWNEATQWEGALGPKGPGVSREDVARLSELGADGPNALGWQVDARLYDLALDPHESNPLVDAERALRMGRALDTLARELAHRRMWRSSDRAALSSDAVEALRGIGYVR